MRAREASAGVERPTSWAGRRAVAWGCGEGGVWRLCLGRGRSASVFLWRWAVRVCVRSEAEEHRIVLVVEFLLVVRPVGKGCEERSV